MDRPFKFLGMKFAPLNTPFRRRIETLGILHMVWWWLLSSVVTVVLLLLLVQSDHFKWIPILYLAFIIYDCETPQKGGRRWKFIRGWRIWKYTGEYFPIKVVKTADLDPERNYVLGSHPHGIFCMGAFFLFSTDAGNWDGLYPGIERRLVAMNVMFWFPSFREIVLSGGVIAASKASIQHVLRRPRSGVTAILVGGAQEALHQNQSHISLVLKQRKGFVKLAIQHGADLIPSFTFGEQKCYTLVPNPEGSLLRRFQEFAKKWISFSPVLFFGRGIFQYSFGPLPKRHPITLVIGAPIVVTKKEDPSLDDISDLHSQYIVALQQLYDTYNPKYGDPDIHLEIQ